MTSKAGTKPLNRSSLEAYAGIVIGLVLALLPMTWWLRILLFLGLIFFTADFIWRSPFTFKWKPSVRRLFAAIAAAWIIWVGFGNVKKAYLDQYLPSNINCLVSWGPAAPGEISNTFPRQYVGVKAGAVTVDGSKLLHFASRYKLLAVCFHSYGLVDVKDIENLSKSATFDITNEKIRIVIPWSDPFFSELQTGSEGTNYRLLLVPNNLKPDSFRTLGQAANQGALMVETDMGPP
jgi:hypothetical protein